MTTIRDQRDGPRPPPPSPYTDPERYLATLIELNRRLKIATYWLILAAAATAITAALHIWRVLT